MTDRSGFKKKQFREVCNKFADFHILGE